MRKILENRWTLWLLLSLPALPLFADFYHDQRYYPEIMHRSGVLACQLLSVALGITPLRMVAAKFTGKIPGSIFAAAGWLMRRRRYLGVASCAYALIHTAFYFRWAEDIETVVAQWADPELLVGWIALVIFVLLAMTSNDFSVRFMGRKWKSLHRWVYPCVVLSFAHWLWFDYDYRGIFLLFIPLLVLQMYRVISKPRRQTVLQQT